MQNDAFPCLARSSTGERTPLQDYERPILIGRDAAADIRIDHPQCSRKQAVVVRHPDGVFLKPISETVPMELDGRPVLGLTNLAHGARIRFAGQELVYLEHAAIPTVRAADLSPTDHGSGSPATIGGVVRYSDEEATTLGIQIQGSGVLGREANARYVLDHPRVSRRHAELVESGGKLWIRDLGSTNGTFVNGMPARNRTPLREGDRVDVGPFSLVLRGDSFEQSTSQGNLRIVARGLTRRVVDRSGGGMLTILNDVSLVIPPRSFVALIGPSGSGKSTLMNALSGREPATEGQVLLNGLDFYQGFESLKQGIAMVHQDEALHPGLTVAEAVRFTGRLRLPADTSQAALEEAVEHSLDQVDLGERAGVRIQDLSGGQRKRASLANETINDPGLLFVDEVTSGLDQDTDREIMQLLRRSADNGRTVVSVTHNLANIDECCSHVVVMAAPGYLAFYGTPEQCLTYFGVTHLSDVYGALEGRAGAEWQERFLASEEHAEHIGRLAESERPGRAMPENLRELGLALGRRLPETLRQFRVLTGRANRLLLQDRETLRIAAAQALVIALVLWLVFAGLQLGSPQDGWYELAGEGLALEASKQRSLLFLLGIACLWFGTSNASKEIVKERTIYRQERDVNLSVTAYVTSKLPGLLGLGLCQAALLLGSVALLVGIPGGAGAAFGVLAASILAGTGLGLWISAVTRTRDQATTLVPILLIPQIVMAGVIAPLDGLALGLSQLLVAGHWIVEAITWQEQAPSPVGLRLRYPDTSQWLLGLGVLCLHFLVYWQAATWILRLRDSRGQTVYGAQVRRILRRPLSKTSSAD